MAVDLSEELIDSLKREVNPPGTDGFVSATEDEWLGNLLDSFWEAKLYGFFTNYSADVDGNVSPITGTDEIPREQQELIVLFAGARVIRNELKNKNTHFRAQAGPVEFEVDNSATLLVQILKDIRSKVDLALAVVGTISATSITYVDSLLGREESIGYGETYVPGAGDGGYYGTYGWS